MTPTQLQAYRERIFNQLKSAGYPIETWQDELDAKIASTPPDQLRRPFTTDVAHESPTITCIPAGFQEFRAHPAHGKPIRRCLAKHPDGNQCGRFALKERRICKRHSGGARHKPDSQRGQHLITHGQETRALRKGRSEAAKKRKMLENQARENGMWIAPSVRGPYSADLKTYQKNRQKWIARMMKQGEFEEATKRREGV